MANLNAPFGFRPARHLTGGSVAAKTDSYKIASGYATTICTGDLVKADGAGNIAKVTAAADVILGVFQGCKYIAADGAIRYSRYWMASTPTKAGTTIEAHVFDDPMITYTVQTSNTVLYANQLKFVDVVDAAGNTNTGQSAQTVGAPGGVASQFAVMGVVDSIPQRTVSATGVQTFTLPADGQYAVLEVRAVKHTLLGSAAGVAA